MAREYLWSLVLATGGAALLAGAASPVTASLVAGNLLGGAAGNLLYTAFAADEERIVAAIFRRNPGVDENFHILLALRQSHLKALKQVITIFDSAWPSDTDRARQIEAKRFSGEAKRFLRAAGLGKETGSGEAAELERSLFSSLPDAFEAALATRGSRPPESAFAEARAARREIEVAVLQELLAETGTTEAELPPSFPNAFAGQPRDGWFDLFVRDGAARLKANPGFRSIWTAEHIARIGHQVGRFHEMLRSIKGDTETLIAFAEEERRKRGIAEGFVHEMAGHVAASPELNIEGKMQAVRNAIEIYEREITGRPTVMSLDGIAGSALAMAKERVDRGQSRLAAEGLFRAAEEMRREEEEHREHYVASQTAFYHRARDIALATYDGNQAGDAIIRLARSVHGQKASKIADVLRSETQALYEYGRDHGSNVHLVAAIALRREQLTLAASREERAAAQNDLGISLSTLGARESGTEKLKEAVEAYRAALQERTREQTPLDWARTQSNLGVALQTLGERDSRTARLEEAVAAHRAALEELTRERVPVDWAMTQINLGNAFKALGERESVTTRLEEAVTAYRAALQERTRERAPLDWAMTQTNLGAALRALGERENGTARLEEAVSAYREALEERTRERFPLQWAATQTSLGVALWRLGERENGTAKLEEAVGAYRGALEETTRERVPLDWGMTQMKLGNALARLGERESGIARLEEATTTYRAALEENTRERVPLDWAMIQNNLGLALWMLGMRESGAERLEQAVAAYRAALQERTRERVPLDWATTQNNLGLALNALGERESGAEKLEEAVKAFDEALRERTRERLPLDSAATLGSQALAKVLIAERTNDGAMAETAVTQIQTAVEALRSSLQQQAAEFEAQLPKARAIRNRLKGK